MNKGHIEYEENGLHIKEMLQPVNLHEQEENRIAKANSKLVFKPRYLNISRVLWTLNKYQMLLLAFFLFYTGSSSDRFYFTNEQLAEMFFTTPQNISYHLNELKKKGYLRLHYKRKANGGQIRFIKMSEIEPTLKMIKLQLKTALSSNSREPDGKDNKIKINKINNRHFKKNVDNYEDRGEEMHLKAEATKRMLEVK